MVSRVQVWVCVACLSLSCWLVGSFVCLFGWFWVGFFFGGGGGGAAC